MDWTQFAIFIAIFIELFNWNHSESRADYRHLEEIKTIDEEIKGFHGRLCAIEERNKK
jgi:hypothetical protein